MENRNYFIVENYGCHEVKISVDEVWFHDSLDSVRIVSSDSAMPIFLGKGDGSINITRDDIYNAVVEEFNRAEEFLRDITLSDVTRKSYFILTKYSGNVICVKLWVNFVSHKASIFCEYSSGIRCVPLNQNDILGSIVNEIENAKKCIDNCPKKSGVFGSLFDRVNSKRLIKKYSDVFDNKS